MQKERDKGAIEMVDRLGQGACVVCVCAECVEEASKDAWGLREVTTILLRRPRPAKSKSKQASAHVAVLMISR